MENAIDKRAQMMGTAKVPTAIIKLAVPAIISMVVVAIYNMADTYFVSMASKGDLEVAAVSVFMPVLLIMQSVAVLFAAGGAALLSRLLGEGKKAEAGRAASITIALTFLSGAVVGLLGLAGCRPLLFAFGASGLTIDMAVEYAAPLFIAAPIQLTNMAFNNLLRAEGSAVRSMAGMVTGAVLNMILDPVFILGFGMGVFGASVATAISQGVSFVILGYHYWRKKTVAQVRFRGLKFERHIVTYILKVGLSTFLIQIFSAVSFAVINICVKPYGDGAIAAVGVVNRLQFMGFALLFGFSQGFQPVAGYNFGARKFDRLKRALAFGITVAVCIGAAITLLYHFFAPQLIGLFSIDPGVIKTGTEALQWFTLAFPVTAFSIIMMMMYQALGKALGATVIAVLRQGVCLIPAVLVLAWLSGWQGILVSPLVADAVSGVVALVLAVRIFAYVKKERQTGGAEVVGAV